MRLLSKPGPLSESGSWGKAQKIKYLQTSNKTIETRLTVFQISQILKRHILRTIFRLCRNNFTVAPAPYHLRAEGVGGF